MFALGPSLFARRPDPASQTGEEPLSPDALLPGTLLGPLRIDRPLARGSSAMLYLATDTATRRVVAVKVLCPQGDDPQGQRARFLHQAEHAGALEHPNIVRIFGGGQVREAAFLAMQFLAGCSLARWTGESRVLPEAAVLDIAVQLAAALAHAHRQGILHRDVKPANAIFDPARRHATLTDFGIARAPDAQASRSGMLIGSPAYMAPELLAGQRADAGSDLYALAVLTYELLTGHAPFEAASMGSLLRAVAQAPPPPLVTLRPDWPAPVAARLDAWFETTLAKDPGRRPADSAAWAVLARRTAGDVSGLIICAANTTNQL
jgi:serine/threonine-protein kinase